MTSAQIYDQLIEHFIKTNELGHHNPEAWSIQLYGMPNQSHVINDLHKRIGQYTQKYNLIVLDPQDEYTNINILDIEL